VTTAAERRLATAPVSWGVWELTIDRTDLLPREAMLDCAASLGYSAIELGPIGYFGFDQGEVEATLSRASMQLAGAFVELHLTDDRSSESDRDLLEQTLDVLVGAAGDPPLLLADAGSPERLSAAGRIGELRRTALRGQALRAAVDRLRRAAERARARGAPVAFHPHAATYFETPYEVQELLELTREDELGICLDTGHTVIGGGDPLELADLCSSRLAHVHLKDVEERLLRQLREGAVDMEQAWEQGIFCPFGEGLVDLPGVISSPAVRDYAGTLVLEQDRMHVTVADLPRVRETERENRRRVLQWIA
jgi:inosose dehydratase